MTDPKKDGGDATARVLNQDEIDSLLGFNDPKAALELSKETRKIMDEYRAKQPSLVGYLRQGGPDDLKRDAADLLEACAALLKKRLRTDPEAQNIIARIERGTFYD